MLQVLQSFKTGKLEVADIPAPERSSGFVLVETTYSAISPGTERAVMNLAKKSLLGKAQERPDLVKQVMDKIAREGLLTTISAVQNRLDKALALGYSSVGRVLETDASVHARVGDRIACGGAGYASHAEIVRVPRNLCALVPESVPDEDAAFATIAAVAVQGIRVASPAFGETVVVLGLGLIGLMAVQIAAAAGCEVIGVDIVPWRLQLARDLGAASALHRETDDVVATVTSASKGVGADAILVTASTSSSDPLELAGEIARARARVVLVGATGTEIPRRTYYEKELSLLLSTSYGPGRYDPSYEERGVDYPIGHVRWTEQRNIAEALRLMARGKLKIAPLRTHVVPIASAEKAYELINQSGGEPVLGVALQYPQRQDKRERPQLPPVTALRSRDVVRVGVLGAGNYARATILPTLSGMKQARIVAIASRGGLSASDLGRAYNVGSVGSDINAILESPDIDAVFIATRHDSHADLAIRALRAGKHVYVEKPPATTLEQLVALREAAESSTCHLVVGYNRDVAPATNFLISELGAGGEVRQAIIRCNAGQVPANSWVHDGAEGGGRWIGEGCHFVALASRLVGSTPLSVAAFGSQGNARSRSDENVAVSISYANGSVSSILYTADGDRSYPKERIEVFGGGSVGLIDDFRKAHVIRAGKTRKFREWKVDKGQETLFEMFLKGCLGKTEGNLRTLTAGWLAATAATIAAGRSLETGKVEVVN